MMQPSKEVVEHYTRLIRNTAEETLKKVLTSNGFPEHPIHGREIKAIPVYEDCEGDNLLKLASIKLPTQITCAATPSNYLQGYFKKYRKEGKLSCEVVILATNYCWTRFYAAKELFHCFLENDGYGATNSLAQVDDLIENLVVAGYLKPDSSPATIVDQVAWLGAYLYLIPETWMPAIKNLHNKLMAKFPDDNVEGYLAQLLRVPEMMLHYRLK